MGINLSRMRLAIVTLAVWPLLAAGADLEEAQKLYHQTDYDASLKLLQGIQPKDGPVYLLIGQDFYMRGDYKKATENLEKAVALDPSNSDYHMWLGRAFGRRAETASPFTAAPHATHARQQLEKAVELNGRNLEAMADLFEYYLEAPGFMGGGMDKANGIAEKMAAVDPVEGHWAQARMAERHKEYDTAEHHLRVAASMAPEEVGKLLELARFLAKQGRYQESEQSFKKAEKIAPNSPRVIYARADTYIKQGRNLDTARKLLHQYLRAQLTPDDPPRSDAEKLLKKASGG